jgi:splicing factor 3A subunit 3
MYKLSNRNQNNANHFQQQSHFVMTTIELIRGAHEEIEVLQRGVVREMNRTPHTAKLRVAQSQRVKHYLDRIGELAAQLKVLYADERGDKKREWEEISGEGPNLYSAFYDQLRELKENYRRFPRNVPSTDALLEYEPHVQFTGEESFGRYLDMHTLHEAYVNLLRAARAHSAASSSTAEGGAAVPEFHAPDYSFFLAKFGSFNDDMWRKFPAAAYRQYITELRDYLVSFIERSQPLYALAEKRAETAQEFERRYEANEFRHWPRDDKVDGGDDDPLFCTVCRKRFAKPTVFESHLDGKKHRAALAAQLDKGTSALPPRDILAIEHEVKRGRRCLYEQSYYCLTLDNLDCRISCIVGQDSSRYNVGK